MTMQNNRQQISPVMFHTMICGIILYAVILYQRYFPVSFIYFVHEDSWLEYGTFACFFLAGLLLLRSMITDSRFRNPGHILLCMGLLFIAMEEISWGQRIFGIHTPHFVSKYNYQSEINIHNNVFVPSDDVLNLVILIWAVVISQVLPKVHFVKSLFSKVGIPLLSFELQPYFVFGFLIRLFELTIKGGELCEFIFGMAFFMFILKLWCKTRENKDQIIVNWTKLCVVSIVVVLTTTAVLSMFIPKKINKLKNAMHTMAESRYPDFGMYDQSIRIYEYLRSNKELQADETLLEYGIFLKKIHDQRAKTILLEAMEKAKELKRLDPNGSAPNILVGKIYKQLENDELSIIEFQKALRKNEEKLLKSEFNWQKFEAYQSMGKIYMEIGNFPLALAHLKRALEYSEEERKAKHIRKIIKVRFGEKI